MRSHSPFHRHLRRLCKAAACGVIAAVGLPLHADLLPTPGVACNPAFDPETNLTWYGNSWGDFADTPGYGWFGWEPYFEIHEPGRGWRIQNLAVGGWTTQSVYTLIRDCAKTQASRQSYRTAANVVLEIGGNDYIAHLPFLIYAPWMYPRIQQRVLSNTEGILVSLRHPRRAKNVLVVGHIPAVSASPTLGPPSDYFRPWTTQPGVDIQAAMDDIRRKKEAGYLEQLLDDSLQAHIEFLRTKFPDELGRVFGVDGGALLGAAGLEQIYRGAECGTLAWYCAWLQLNESDLGMSALSLAMMLHNGPLEAVAARNGAEWLPVYQTFAREADCLRGSCWVAKHQLYNDPIHKSYLGYYTYAYHVSRRLVELGWHQNLPTNGGLIENPAAALPPEQEGVVVDGIVQPDNTDLLILYCLFTGACW